MAKDVPQPARDRDGWHGRPVRVTTTGRFAADRRPHAERLPPARGSSEAYSDQPRRRRWWPALTAVAVVAIGVSLLSPAARRQWALSFIRQPSHYTTLYFNEPDTLPTTAVSNRPMTVSFTVGNHERRAVNYRFVITAVGGGVKRSLAHSQKIVTAGATWRISATVRPVCPTTQCRIEVSLPGHPETIDFLVTLKASGKKHG